MYPALREGDSLHIQYFKAPKKIQEIPVGQIVLLNESKEWVAHRVVEIDNRKYTKGDWSYPIDQSTVAWGRVVGVNGSVIGVENSSFIAKISSRINKRQNRLLRTIKKIKLIVVVIFLRNLMKGDSYDNND